MVTECRIVLAHLPPNLSRSIVLDAQQANLPIPGNVIVGIDRKVIRYYRRA